VRINDDIANAEEDIIDDNGVSLNNGIPTFNGVRQYVEGCLNDYAEARIIHFDWGSGLTDEQKAYNAETYQKIATGEKMLIQIVIGNEIIVPTTIAYGNGVATLERTKVDNSKNGDTVTATLREDGTASLMTTLLLFPTVDREMSNYSYNAIANAVVKQYIDDEIVKAKPVYDKGMSDTSDNAVSNRVIKEYIDALLGYAPLHTLYDILTIVNTPDAIDDIARQRLYQLIGYTEGGEIPTDSKWFIDSNGFHYVINAMDSGNGTPVIMILGNEGYTLILPDNTKQNELIADKTTLADVKAYTDGKFFSQAQFDPAKTHDYVKSYIHYDDEAPKTLELGVDLIIQDDIANAAEDDLDNGVFNNGLVTALGVKQYVEDKIEEGGGGATERVAMTAASAAIEPNKFYVWPMMDSLDVSLGAEQSGVMNRYLFQFRNPKAGVTLLTLPDSITWSEDTELDENGLPVMEAAAFYRVEIIEGLASLKKWKLVYINFADAEVERVLMANGIGDGIGITKRDAKAVTSIGTWFKSNKVIVQFPELPLFGIKEIPNDSFNGCSALQAIELPSAITRIGNYAFYQCTSMEIDIVADNITEIGQRAFYQSAITSFSSESVGTIGNFAFNGCPNLHKVRLGEGCTYVGADSFAGCGNLKAVAIGSNVATIMNYAFGNCSGLNEIVIYAITPPSLPYTNALTNTNNCPIYVPDASVEAYKSATNWLNYAPRIYSLTDYVLGAIIIEFADDEVKTICLANYDLNGDGELQNREAWTVTSFGKVFNGKPITSFRESAKFINVTAYGLSSFSDCTSLVEIDLSNAVSIVDGAFASCSSLAWVGSLEKVQTLGNAAFRYCSALTIDVCMPNLSTLQGNYAFASSGVVSVRSLGTITATQFQMFASCTSLRYAILPSTLETLAGATFGGCTSMEAIIMKPTTPPSVGNMNALNNTNNCPIYVPDASVDAYKAASNWSQYSDRIKPLSEYTE
jgi:hypothetical protein